MKTRDQLRAITHTTTRFYRAALAVTAAGGLALSSQPVSAVTVFSDSFSSSTLNVTPGSPTANATTYEIASTKNTAGSSIAAGDLKLTMASTSSGLIEAQALFTTAPITLAATGDYIDFTLVFTNTAGILLTGKNNSQLTLGLFNAGGVAPLAGVLTNSGLSATAGSPYATGGAQLWQGYFGKILQSGTAAILTRPQQNGAGTTSANQDMLFNKAGGGAFNNPTGVNIGTKGSTTVALTAGSQYTAYLRLTYDATANSIIISNSLFSGGDTSGTLLFVESATAAGTTNLTATFDGLAFGWRYSGTSGDPATTMDVNSIAVTTNVIPEPSTLAMAGLGLGLVIAAIRRRRC